MKDMRTYVSRKMNWLSDPHAPLRILGTIAIAVFIGETMVMFLLAGLPKLPIVQEAILDSTLLIVLISPALFLFLFQPIIRQKEAREKAEKKVRENHNLLQAVFNGISDPLILLDGSTKVKMINDSARHYYKIEGPLAIDRQCHEALLGKHAPCAECDIPAMIAENKSVTMERKGLFDESRIEKVVIYQSKALSGQDRATIVRISDVTEEKALQGQIRRRERMASLGLLISGVSHEINNPNNFISFNIPILRDYLDEIMPIVDRHADLHPDLEIAEMPYPDFREDLFKMMENITHGSKRINSIISRLKEFSRMQDSRRLRKVKINPVLEKVAELTSSQIKRMVKRFEYEVPPDLPMIKTDAQAIEQMVLNLLINACQAADKSNSWVSLEARLDPKPPYALCIEISDNGCGIDEKTLQRIFDPLFTTKGPDSGTGLGLYICHNLAEGLGGAIEVQSTPGMGSTFRLMLPDLQEVKLPPQKARQRG